MAFGRGGFGNAPADVGMKLYVGGLHFSITSEQLHALFAPFGEIEKVDGCVALPCLALPCAALPCPALPHPP